MSNSRIFCIAWVVFSSLDVIARLAGVTPAYEGIDRLIAQCLISTVWGATAVALIGDRKAKP